MSEKSPIAVLVDARDMLCPLPVLKARKALKGVEPGQCVEVLATDPAADADFKAFCDSTGHRLSAATKQEDGVLRFVIERSQV